MRIPTSIRILAAAGLVAATAIPFAPVRVAAQGPVTNLAVYASVVANCTITATTIGFGSYDPVTAHATANLDAQGSLTVACTKGVNPSVGLDNGTNGTGESVRRLAGNGSYLTYELYKEEARTNAWRNLGSGLLSLGTAPSKSPRTFPVFARLPGGQDVPPGTYTDTIVATVNF